MAAADASAPKSAAEGGATATAPSPAAEAPVLPGQAAAPAASAIETALSAAGLARLSVTIDGPLESAMRPAVGDALAAPLSQVTARLFVWWLDPMRDLRRGDLVEVLYETVEGKEPIIHALALTSQKTGQRHTAFLHKSASGPFARYYDARGTEVEERLIGGPIESYEQVTSMLRDGRKHAGVDFKAPVGTPVKLPFSATLVRKNWNWRFNGNALEFREPSGRKILFLHLAELPKSLKPGQTFKAGQLIAQSGNTGRSTAPHLHYQLESPSGKILDPFDLHKTHHLALRAEELPAFEQTRTRLERLLSGQPPVAEAGSVQVPVQQAAP